jgi:hypothetical protein
LFSYDRLTRHGLLHFKPQLSPSAAFSIIPIGVGVCPFH